VRLFGGHSSSVESVAFSPDGRFVLTGSEDGTTRLWGAAAGAELCSLISFKDRTWAVIAPDNRYDSSNDGDVAGLRWTVGMESRPCSAFRDRYYTPGLLAEILASYR
jgi:WD40 repeat protein